ncbi:MAG TPA: phosphotransferase family protein, partial [Acidimicrobiales bacterium]|nr:phosphotransferase family protein [Acidimicrobiales bacterium]
WLKAQLGLRGAPTVKQFTGGASNLTYLMRYPSGDELILRRPPAGAPAAAHDMAREYRVQKLLKPVFPYVPTTRALCQDQSVIGCDFYVMDRVAGAILRGDGQVEQQLTRDDCRALAETFVDTLASLHSIEPDKAGLHTIGKGGGYVARQVEGWTRRYNRARTHDVPSFNSVTQWLTAHRPAEVASRVVHNDWRLDNIVLDLTDMSVVGILDWELATLGDPLMDLGNAMAYWVDADDDRIALAYQRQPSSLAGMLTRAEIVDRYIKLTGLDARDWPFYEVFGLFRLAGIAQQIYYRYHHGHTTNPQFSDLWVFVKYLNWRCQSIIRQRP